MAEQLVFPISETPSLTRADFIPSPANDLALRQIGRWSEWGYGKLVLTGPEGGGKSHLAAIWAAEAGGITLPAREAHLDLPTCPIAFDGMEGLTDEVQEVIFHLHNRLTAEGQPMMFTGQGPLASWGLTLPDLRSRLGQAEQAEIHPPDDMLLEALLIKRFTDRQIQVTPPTIAFLLTHLERSYQSVHNMVSVLDSHSLRQKRKITRDLARDILAALAADQDKDNAP